MKQYEAQNLGILYCIEILHISESACIFFIRRYEMHLQIPKIQEQLRTMQR